MKQHTRTPWKVYEDELRPKFPVPCLEIQDSRGRPIVPWIGFDACDLPKGQIRANAAFIVLAVNSHDALLLAAQHMVEALRDLRDAHGLAYYHGDALDAGLQAIARAEGRERP